MITNYVRDTAKHDSHLYLGGANRTTNADLQLILRVFIRPGATGTNVVSSVNAAGAIYTHDAVAWAPGELDKFRTKYKHLAETAWTNKFWLKTPVSCADLIHPFDGQAGPKARVNLRCRLIINLLTDTNDAHKVIDAVKYVPNPASIPPRANDRTYFQDTLNRAPHTDLGGRRYYQDTVVHEVGHALGLPHVGVSVGTMITPLVPGSPVCSVATQNQVICYEGSNVRQTNDIMGLGNTFSTRDAQPWLDRVTQHTAIAVAQWTTSLTRLAPVPVH